MRVLALVTLPTLGAGNRLRVVQYVGPLKDHGIDLVVSSFFSDDELEILYRPGHVVAKAVAVIRGIARRICDLTRAARFDLVLVYRESAPLGPPLFEGLLRLIGVRYVFDFDDAVFLGPIHPANRRWAWLRDPSRVGAAARGAVSVIAGNDYLADWARNHNPNVTVIPTPVDTEHHRPAQARDPRPRPLVLGWVGSSTTAPYLGLLDDALAILAEKMDVVFRVVGGDYSHPTATVELRPYRLETEPLELEAFDIGLLPEPDDQWTRGKGAFKALLYMATQLPVVASRVGVNQEVVVDGETGFCVDDTAGWVTAIERLAADPELRRRFGAAGRQRVERLFSLRAQTPRFANALREAARTR